MSMLTMHTGARRLCALLVGLALCACGKPQPPDRERPPEPQAATPATQTVPLREAVQAPIERAKQVDADVQKAAEAQRAAIDAATGG
jgi:hypothetical protein